MSLRIYVCIKEMNTTFAPFVDHSKKSKYTHEPNQTL